MGTRFLLLARAREASKLRQSNRDLFVFDIFISSSSLTFVLLCRGKPVLLPTILSLLCDELDLDAKVDDNNVGRIRVTGASIDNFIETRRWKE